jgi:hypothetical protein
MCKTLRHLDLSCCNKITNASLAQIAAVCGNLESLQLRNCKKVDRHGINRARQLFDRDSITILLG